MTADADLLIVAFGTAAAWRCRRCAQARQAGLQVGCSGPSRCGRSEAALKAAARRRSGILVVEMNAGQMLEDVRWHRRGSRPVRFFGRTGGICLCRMRSCRRAQAELAAATPSRATRAEWPA